MIKSPNSIMKSGNLTKMGSKANKKIEKRFIVLKSHYIFWYHDEAESGKQKPLGIIPLNAVYHCVPANRFKSTSDLMVSICIIDKVIDWNLCLDVEKH
jgi:hypothetical protein